MRSSTLNIFRQMFSYVVISGSAYLLHIMFVWLVTNALANPITFGFVTTLSFLFVSVLSYFLHRRFTFKSEVDIFRSFIKFMAVVSAGALLSGIISYSVKELFSGYLIVAVQLFFIGLWSCMSIFLMKRFIFTQRLMHIRSD